MTDYTGTDNLEVMAAAVEYNRYLLDLIRAEIRPGMRVLDLGAGIGTFAHSLRQEGVDITCFEPDKDQAAHIQSLGIPVEKELRQIQNGRFDLIYSLNVLEHIRDDQAAVRDWVALLKPGGRMLIYVPAFQCLYSSMDRKVGHFRRYRRHSLEKLVREFDGKLVKSGYADSIGFIASIAYKYSGNKSGDIDQQALKVYDRYVFPISRVLDRVLGSMIGKNAYLLWEKSVDDSSDRD